MQESEIIKYENRALQKINNAISITTKLLSTNLKPINIFWLEDHKLYFDGASICILKKFPNATFIHFIDGDEALHSISKLIVQNTIIDIIITDLRHPGIDGVKFLKKVRSVEVSKIKKIPILLLSMMYSDDFDEKIDEVPNSKYLPKSTSGEEIVLTISNLI